MDVLEDEGTDSDMEEYRPPKPRLTRNTTTGKHIRDLSKSILSWSTIGCIDETKCSAHAKFVKPIANYVQKRNLASLAKSIFLSSANSREVFEMIQHCYNVVMVPYTEQDCPVLKFTHGVLFCGFDNVIYTGSQRLCTNKTRENEE